MPIFEIVVEKVITVRNTYKINSQTEECARKNVILGVGGPPIKTDTIHSRVTKIISSAHVSKSDNGRNRAGVDYGE